MLLVCLTGNYGMGKSSVLNLFKEIGALTISSDEIVSSLLEDKDVIEKIKSLFREDVINNNGTLDKSKVADLVFKDSTYRHALEDILHPLVFKKIKEYINRIKDKGVIVVVEMPLVFERGYEGRFDRIITVYTEEEVALRRLEGKGIDRHKSLMRLRAQMPVSEKIRRSDFVIDNNGTIEQTMNQVKEIFLQLKGLEGSNIENC
jgi:dephospho-CoA kinase